jgi:simple sugar transport system permease protein
MDWTQLLTEAFLVSLLAGAIRLSTPIILAGLGEVFAERSGVLNLGVEGVMLMGAFASFWGASVTGSPWLGLLIGMLAGVIMALIMAFFSVTLGADQVISGMGLYLLGVGMSSFLYRIAFGVRTTPPSIEGLESLSIPILSDIPILGPILFQHDALVYLALLLVPILSFVLARTTLGLKIKAVGENPEAADTVGVNVKAIRYLCVIVGGILGALGGAHIAVAHLKIFADNMTVGRGFIAVAIVYFGKWRPFMTFVGALVFGGAYALQLWIQASGAPIPHQVLLMLPYALTIVILALVARQARGPAALTKPFRRGEG